MEIDFKVPTDWQALEIREIGEVVTGRTPSTKREDFYGGQYKLISPNDLDNGKYVTTAHRWLTSAGFRECRALPKDTVLVGCIGNVGKLGMVQDAKAATNQQINAVICNQNNDPHFVYYSFYANRVRLERAADKTTVPILNKTNFEAFRIAVPSLQEQRTIAAVLGLVQRAIEHQERLLALTAELKKTLLQQLFTHGLRNEPQKQTDIGLIPQNWKVATIGEVTTVVYRYPSYYGITYVKSGIPEIRGELLRDNGDIEHDINKFRFVSEETASKFPKIRLEVGDIVMSVRGTMGKIGQVNERLSNGVITANLIRLAPDAQKIIPGFFRWVLLAPRFLQSLNAASPQTTIKTITASNLKELKIPLPEILEQKEIADTLQSADRSEQIHRRKHRALNLLFRTLLQELMTARIRVKNLDT